MNLIEVGPRKAMRPVKCFLTNLDTSHDVLQAGTRYPQTGLEHFLNMNISLLLGIGKGSAAQIQHKIHPGFAKGVQILERLDAILSTIVSTFPF